MHFYKCSIFSFLAKVLPTVPDNISYFIRMISGAIVLHYCRWLGVPIQPRLPAREPSSLDNTVRHGWGGQKGGAAGEAVGKS